MSIEKPTDELSEDLRAHLRSIGMSDEQIDDFWRQVDSGEAYMVAPLKTYDVPPFEPKEWPVTTQGQFIKLIDVGLAVLGAETTGPFIDWENAPEGATHGLAGPCWRKVGAGSEPCYWWSEHRRDWYESLITSAQQLAVAGIVARPVEPEEVWSRDGLDGAWNFDSLAEMIKSDYGHGADSAGPMSDDGSLQIGDIVHRGIKCFDDPGRWVPDADEVANHMYEQAHGSDAGEWADDYPDLSKEAEEALKVALEPLKAWARKHAQPTFFTVEKATTHELTEEDVRVAFAKDGAQ